MFKTKSQSHLWWALLVILTLMVALTACKSATPEPTEAPATAVVEPTSAPTEAPTAVPTEVPAPTEVPVTEPLTTTVLIDFETDGTGYDGYQATASMGDIAYAGAGSLKSESTEGEWHGVGATFPNGPVDLSGYNQLCFMVYDTTTNNNGKAANTVGVKLLDASGAGTERYTDNEGVGANVKTKLNEWTPMCLNLITFTGIDMTQIEKIEFTMYWAGTYYFDEVTALPVGAEFFTATEPTGEVVTTLAQGFEAEDTYYSDYQADVSLETTIVHSGASSLKAASSEGEWHAFGGLLDPSPFDASSYNKVCFWIYDTTEGDTGNSDNTVGVKLFDASGANEEVWTDNELAGGNPKTAKNTWVQMCLNLDAYQSVDTSQLEKVQFAMYWAGDYYVDDIEFVSTGSAGVPVLVQGFEAEETYYSDYQADVSLDTEIFHSGVSSLKAASSEGEWHAFGAYPDPRPFDGSGYDKMCFWIYDTTEGDTGNSDNTVGVKLFDASGANEEVWTDHELAGENPKTAKNTWVQMCLNLDAYQSVDTSQIDKIQFALYWAGDYYVDDIEFVGTASPSTEAETPVMAPNVFVPAQDFEADGTSYEVYQVTLSLDTETFHSGASSLKSESTEGEWHTTGVNFDGAPVDASGYQQLCFWWNDTTDHNDGKADNTIALKLFDATGTNQEFWSDNAAIGTNGKSVQNEWVQFCFGLDAYTDIDLTQLEKAEVALYWFGTYYFDGFEFASYDPNAAAAPKTGDVAQDFEADGTFYEVYQVTLSMDKEIVKSGASSLKSESTEGEWHTTGINFDGAPVDASGYTAICFWWYDTTDHNSGNADNTIALKLFDATGANQEYWSDNAAIGSNGKSVQNEWVQSCFNLEAYTDIDLTQLEKAEVALYWFGTYYFDLVEFIP